MIIDVFPFLNEYDLLDIRLHELDTVVDRFVIVEGAHTFTNKPKPYNFESQLDRFSKFLKKILYVKIPNFSLANRGPFGIEMETRYTTVFASQAAPDDIIIMSELDEIPRKESVLKAVEELKKTGRKQMIEIKLFFYGLNFAADAEWEKWPGPAIAFRKDIWDTERFRVDKVNYNIIPNGGWHYTYFGGAEQIRYKLGSYSHAPEIPQENFDINKIKELVESGKSVCGCTRTFHREELTELNCPSYVLANLDKFKHLIL